VTSGDNPSSLLRYASTFLYSCFHRCTVTNCGASNHFHAPELIQHMSVYCIIRGHSMRGWPSFCSASDHFSAKITRCGSNRGNSLQDLTNKRLSFDELFFLTWAVGVRLHRFHTGSPLLPSMPPVHVSPRQPPDITCPLIAVSPARSRCLQCDSPFPSRCRGAYSP